MGMLLPKISAGISLGALISIFLGISVYGFSNGSIGEILALFVFVGTIGSSIFLAQKHEELCSYIRISLFVGLMLCVSIDLTLSGGFVAVISRVLRAEAPDYNMCYSACHVPALLLLWLIFSTSFFFLQAHAHGFLNTLLSRYRYGTAHPHSLLSTTEAAPITQLPVKKTDNYPDSLEPNYFDPDNLPELLQGYSQVIYDTAINLQSMYGFQVDNSRNQAEHLLMMLANEQIPTDTLLSSPLNDYMPSCLPITRNGAIECVYHPTLSDECQGKYMPT